MKEPTKKQLIRLKVTSAGESVETQNVTTDEYYTNVESYNMFVPTPNGEQKSTMYLSIDGYEIEPEKYPVEGCIASTSVAPDKRMKSVPFPIKAKGSQVVLKYTDGGNARTYPHTVVLCLKLVKKPENSNKEAE